MEPAYRICYGEERGGGLKLFWRDDLCPDTMMVDTGLQGNGRGR
jgi:hypothetical protein